MNNEVLVNAYKTILEFEPLIYGASLFLGLLFFITGLLKMAQANQRQEGLGVAITYIIGGLLLLNAMGVINMVSQTFLGIGIEDSLFATSAGTGENKELVQLAIGGIHAIGLFGFIRGVFLLNKNGQQGGGKAAGLVHIVGGVLCLNIEVFATMLGATLGGQVQELVNSIL